MTGFDMKLMRCVCCTLLYMYTVSGISQSFTNVAPALGITGGYGTHSFTGGGGVSFVDFNQDGLDDLTFCTAATEQTKFYLNTGTAFMLVDPPYVVNTLATSQPVWVDIDNDGDLDLYITGYNAQSRLYQNTGNMTFTDITVASGLPTANLRTYGANFGDYDRDGFLDVYITNYGQSPAGYPNALYHNNGDLTFTDVTTLTGTSNGAQQSFCSTFFDYDNNGTSDLYVVNDRFDFPNALYAVNEEGVFTDVSVASQSNITIWAMNGGVGDYNNDGFLDLYITNASGGTNHAWLLHNNGDSTFTDSSATAGVTFNRFGWGGNFFDYDNDCDLDLYVCCSQFGITGDPNAFFVNQGNGTFTEPLFATDGLGGIDTMSSHANAIGDFNNDGLPDIAVSNANYGSFVYPFLLWKNENVNTGNWIKINLIGHRSNRDGIGAMLQFWINGTKYIRYTHTANAYLAQNSKSILFGMGTATGLDSLKIIWPAANSVDVISGTELLINQVNTIHEGCASNVVTTLADSGGGSLRKVLTCAAAGDSILFSGNLAGDTIDISSAVLQLNRDVVIYSTLVPKINIRSLISGAVEILPNADVKIHNLNLISGVAGNPAALLNTGTLELYQTNIKKNTALPPNQQLLRNQGILSVHNDCHID